MSNNVKVSKNNSIEAMRFIFMLIICCWHNYASAGVFKHGYLAVEFFFVLSGYLLYKSFSKQNSLSTIDYTIKKIKRFGPEYLIVLAIIYLRHLFIPVILGRREFDFAFMMKMFPEMIMLQDCGIYEGGANAPLWYLSILVIGGGLIYSLLKYNKRLSINVCLPLLCLIGYTYIFNESQTGSIEVWDVEGGIKAALLRGMAGMSLGVLLSYFMEQKGGILEKKPAFTCFVSIISLLMFLFVITSTPYYDKYALLFIPPILLGCFIRESIINKVFASSIWISMGGITFEMLLLHFRIIMPFHSFIFNITNIPICLNYLVYILLLIICSWAFKFMFNKSKSLLSAKCHFLL